jgi:Zn-dependent protease/predicted transcriptional regulator
MKFSLRLGRIAGIRLSVHWTFFLLVLWFFYGAYKQTGTFIGGGWAVLFLLAVFVCVLLHEFGHALTGRYFGVRTESITLLPIGGIADMDSIPEKPSQELRIALAGPVVNLVIAGLVYAGFLVTGISPQLDLTALNYTLSGFASQLLITNLMLAVFNLIPAFPMDGGRVLRAVLGYFTDHERATVLAARTGQVLALGFIFLGFYVNPMLILIGIFIFTGARMEANYESSRSVLYRFKVRDAVMRQITGLDPKDTVAHAAQVLLNGSEKNFLVLDGQELAGVISRKEIIKGLLENGPDTPLESVMRTDFPVLQMNTHMDEAYRQLLLENASFAPVFSGEKLEGLLDIDNLTELLMLHPLKRKMEDDHKEPDSRPAILLNKSLSAANQNIHL